jgi:hypothetical protein
VNINSDLIVYGVIGGLVLLVILTVIFVSAKSHAIRRALGDVDGFLRAIHDDGIDARGLVSAVREHVVRTENGKLVLSRPLPELRREYAEDEVAHSFWFSLGGILTGMSLVATFILIALVMKYDVSGAIRESGGGDEAASTGHLASAVGLLGGKFFISAAGVGGSVLALLLTNWQRARIFLLAEHPGQRLMSAFLSVEALQLNAKLHQMELLRAERESRLQQHEEVCRHFDTLTTRIEKLNSIEVSVKTIGNEVSANLKNIMKDAMGEQLKDMLETTMVDVANIATRVQQELSESFGKQLQFLAGEVQRSLAAVQKAVEGQGQGQLEKILDQLQNTVSGGFQNESQKMIAALEGFASVVPALELQLRTMTGKVAEESRQRAQESAEMNQALMQRVSSLLETMSAQQAANAQAIERIQAASEQGAEAMARRLEASGAGLVSNVLGASRAEIEAIVGQLRVAAEASVRQYGDIDAQASNAAAAVTQATQGLIASANSIIEVANKTSHLVAQTRGSSEAIQSASQQFLHAGSTLLGSVQQMQAVIEATRVQTKEQHDLLLKQREYTKEVERLWPTLFDTYLNRFKAGAEELGRSWEGFHQKISSVSNTVGADFGHNTEVLSEAVDKLVTHLTNSKRVTT